VISFVAGLLAVGVAIFPTSSSALVEMVARLVVPELLAGEQRDFLGG
jgi:hypothetical protein